MARWHKAVVVTGPNGVGKTKVAYELARRTGGEVINLDKLYLYRDFQIITGLADTLKETGVRRHLYQLLDTDEPLLAADEYAQMVKERCFELLAGDVLPVIEGGSTTYLPAVYELNKHDPFIAPIVAFDFADPASQRERVTARVEQALAEGMLEQARQVRARYPESEIALRTDFGTPLIAHLNGERGFEETKRLIVERCLAYSARQLDLLRSYPDITWLEHDPAVPSATAGRIADLCA